MQVLSEPRFLISAAEVRRDRILRPRGPEWGRGARWKRLLLVRDGHF